MHGYALVDCMWRIVHKEGLGTRCFVLLQVAQYAVHEVLLHQAPCLHVPPIMPGGGVSAMCVQKPRADRQIN